MDSLTQTYTGSSIPTTFKPKNGQFERAYAHYSALIETSQCLSRTSDFNEVMQLILEKMLDILTADTGVVALVYEGGETQIIGGRDARRNLLNTDDIQLSQAVLKRLFDSGDVVCVGEVARDSALRHDPVLAQQRINAVVALPMFQRKSMLGLVYLASSTTLPLIDELDLATLKSMAAQLSLVIDDYIALDEVARLNESLETEIQERTTQLSEANLWLADALQKAEQKVAEQAEIEKKRSRYFSVLSHELRSPMQLLLGHTYILLQEGSDRLTDMQLQSLDMIRKTGDYLHDLVSKVIDAGRLDEGAMPIEAVPFNIRPVIDETLSLCGGLLGDKEVELLHAYPPNLPHVLGDPIRIRQVLLNLLTNACKFTVQGKIIAEAHQEDGYVVISVADTGKGIPADKLESIFELYSQADTVRSHKGAGLGLAISKQLVERHGGQMWVKSSEGRGSTFFFTLPVVFN